MDRGSAQRLAPAERALWRGGSGGGTGDLVSQGGLSPLRVVRLETGCHGGCLGDGLGRERGGQSGAEMRRQRWK
jgi:hypothetical protein